MSEFLLKALVHIFVTLVITGVIYLVAYVWPKAPPFEPDEDGWIELKNGVFLWVLGVFCLPLGILMFTSPWLFADMEGLMYLGWVGGSLFLGALSLWGFAYIFWVRIRFDETGVHYRGFTKLLAVRWNEIHKLVDSETFGAYFTSNQGRLFVWKYKRGFPELVAIAEEKGVDVSDFE